MYIGCTAVDRCLKQDAVYGWWLITWLGREGLLTVAGLLVKHMVLQTGVLVVTGCVDGHKLILLHFGVVWMIAAGFGDGLGCLLIIGIALRTPL